MNINKKVKNKEKSIKHKEADFIPILSLLYVFISSVIHFGKSIHSMILYEFYMRPQIKKRANSDYDLF